MKKDMLLTTESLIHYVATQAEPIHRRDIARAFGVKGDKDRRFLKIMLHECVEKNELLKRGKVYWIPASSTSETNDQSHKKGEAQNTAPSLLGILQKDHNRMLLAPLDRRDQTLYVVDSQSVHSLQAKVGDYVECEHSGSSSAARRQNKVILKTILSSRDDLVRNLSVLAIKRYEIPDEFPEEVIVEASQKVCPQINEDSQKETKSDFRQDIKRQDIRHIPLVTIDDHDARDHDDAVYVEKDTDENNQGGWRILVAIADVEHFVTPGSPLDQEALKRGNSTYFPDRVVPMLPEKLSNDLCSLVPDQDRPCLAVWMRISKWGKLLSHRFFKGMMRSQGKLTYKGVQNFYDHLQDQHDDLNELKVESGIPKDMDPQIIDNLYKAYFCLKKAREKRGTLDLELPEQRIHISDQGQIERIEARERLDAHQLIEEFMVLANVAAARFITSKQKPTLFRVHEPPAEDRVEELGLYLKTQNLPVSVNKGAVLKPVNFTQILKKIADHPLSPVINQMVLRSQSRAEYTPDNLGHFGLNLSHYAHFTSPIRRYADLIVHRAISSILAKKAALYPYTEDSLTKIGENISATERRSAKAERETIDRYVAFHLENRRGDTFSGVISGMTDFALFLTLEETGTDGILPLRNLHGDYFTYDARTQTVKGRRSKTVFHLGDSLPVSLEMANPISGSVILSYQCENKRGKNKKFGKRKPDIKSRLSKQKGKKKKISSAQKKTASKTR